MRMLIVGAAFFAALIAPVSAETQHDRKLEQAMMDIVAARIGDIRGSFTYDREPEFVTAQDTVTTGSIRVDKPQEIAGGELREGLTLAIDRKASRIISF